MNFKKLFGVNVADTAVSATLFDAPHPQLAKEWILRTFPDVIFIGNGSKKVESTYYPRDPDEGSDPIVTEHQVELFIFEDRGSRFQIYNFNPMKLEAVSSENLDEILKAIKLNLHRRRVQLRREIKNSVSLPADLNLAELARLTGATWTFEKRSEDSWTLTTMYPDLLAMRVWSFWASGGFNLIGMDITLPTKMVFTLTGLREIDPDYRGFTEVEVSAITKEPRINAAWAWIQNFYGV